MINQSLYRQLDSYHNLEENWDSYGGMPINPKSIENVKKIFNELTKYDLIYYSIDIGALASGGIDIYISHSNIYRMLVVDENDIIDGFIIYNYRKENESKPQHYEFVMNDLFSLIN